MGVFNPASAQPYYTEGSAPAAGAEASLVIEPNRAVLVASIACEIYFDANGRVPALIIVRDATKILLTTRFSPSIGGGTYRLNYFAACGPNLTSNQLGNVASLPNNLILIGGDLIVTSTTALTPPDQYSALLLTGIAWPFE